jgi:pimeloyl-ACP methyl ester carboxylesterase
VAKLSYSDDGTGPAVLLLHAFPLNRAMWAPQIDDLRNRFRVIAPDLHGFGQTPASGQWTLVEAADDVAELLDALKVQDVAVVGLSMGGYLALPFYAKFSERVRKLVLADTRARADNDAEKSARSEMIAALEQFGAGILADRMIPRLLKPEPDVAVANRVRTMIETLAVDSAIHALMAIRDRADASAVLERVSCPLLVIAGELDAVTRVDECQMMAVRADGGECVTIPNAGHLSNLENVDAFNKALAAFL